MARVIFHPWLPARRYVLELLGPFVPDNFIYEYWPLGPTGGQRCAHTPAQPLRVHSLCLPSRLYSVNLLFKMLPKQRAWHKFASCAAQAG
jgi:hypothetical protein